jgi:hypothetical protein
MRTDRFCGVWPRAVSAEGFSRSELKLSPAFTCRYRRFADALTDADARLAVIVVR